MQRSPYCSNTTTGAYSEGSVCSSRADDPSAEFSPRPAAAAITTAASTSIEVRLCMNRLIFQSDGQPERRAAHPVPVLLIDGVPKPAFQQVARLQIRQDVR